MNKFVMTTALVSALTLSACAPGVPTSDQIQNQKQEELSKQGVEAVGLPAIKNFQEKRILRDILELRDNPKFATYTYTEDMNGKLHLRCHSIGYGLPYATQYTNPQSRQVTTSSGGGITSDVMAQADPNGLYSPASAEGTWVMCLNPKTKKAEPQYIEPRIVTLTYPLE